MRKKLVYFVLATLASGVNVKAEDVTIMYNHHNPIYAVWTKPEDGYRKTVETRYIIKDGASIVASKKGNLTNYDLNFIDFPIFKIERYNADDKLDGKYEEYYQNGKTINEGEYKNGNKIGEWINHPSADDEYTGLSIAVYDDNGKHIKNYNKEEIKKYIETKEKEKQDALADAKKSQYEADQKKAGQEKILCPLDGKKNKHGICIENEEGKIFDEANHLFKRTCQYEHGERVGECVLEERDNKDATEFRIKKRETFIKGIKGPVSIINFSRGFKSGLEIHNVYNQKTISIVSCFNTVHGKDLEDFDVKAVIKNCVDRAKKANPKATDTIYSCEINQCLEKDVTKQTDNWISEKIDKEMGLDIEGIKSGLINSKSCKASFEFKKEKTVIKYKDGKTEKVSIYNTSRCISFAIRRR